ncbi:MAG: hypothetical protein R6W76_15910 [Caldilinea sp.]
MFQFGVGVFFILHGLVHLLWFIVPWRITTVDGLPYATTVLAGRIDVGKTGIKVVGLFWPLATVAWVLAGVSVIALASWWPGLTVAVAIFSSALCVLGLPVANYGLLMNLAILLFVLANGRFHWLA